MIHSFAISLPLSRTNTDHTARQAQANQPPSNAKGQTATVRGMNFYISHFLSRQPTERCLLCSQFTHHDLITYITNSRQFWPDQLRYIDVELKCMQSRVAINRMHSQYRTNFIINGVVAVKSFIPSQSLPPLYKKTKSNPECRCRNGPRSKNSAIIQIVQGLIED